MTPPTRLALSLAVALFATTGCALDPTLVSAVLAGSGSPGTATASPGPRPNGSPGPNTPSGLAATTQGFRPPVGATTELAVLDIVNQTRTLAGLPAVTLDAAMSTACAHHAHYIVLNKGTPAVEEGLNAHHEDMSLPGATADGKAAGEASDLSWNEPISAIYGLIGTLYHRTPILNARIDRIGFGHAQDATGYQSTVLMFHYGAGADATVAFPVDGQVDVPLLFLGGERPDPLPAGAGPAGYPITLAVAGKHLTGVVATVTDARGQDVPCYESDDEHPASSFPQGGVVCLFPKQPLLPATPYTVNIAGQLDGQARTWRWRFTTEAPHPADAQQVDQLAALSRHVVVLQGDVSSAKLQPDGSLRLYLATAPGSNVLVSVPAAQHPAVAVYTARRIEAHGTLAAFDGGFYSVEVANPSDLKVLDQAPPTVAATDDAALHRAVGHLSLVRGTVVYAGSDTSGSGVFVSFSQSGPDHTAFMSNAVWQQLNLGTPASLMGKAVALRCVPRSISNDTAIELDVASPDQFAVDG